MRYHITNNTDQWITLGTGNIECDMLDITLTPHGGMEFDADDRQMEVVNRTLEEHPEINESVTLRQI